MKKYLFALIACASMLSSCEPKDKIGYSYYPHLFYFHDRIEEIQTDTEPQSLKLQITRAHVDHTTNIGVSFVVLEDKEIPEGQRAVEGVDFTLSSKRVLFRGDDPLAHVTLTINPVASEKKLKLRMDYTHKWQAQEGWMDEMEITLLPPKE